MDKKSKKQKKAKKAKKLGLKVKSKKKNKKKNKNHEYNAASIKILSEEQIKEFPWKIVEKAVVKYNKPRLCAERAVEACILGHVDPKKYYIGKYCKGKNIPLNKDVDEIYGELLKRSKYQQQASMEKFKSES